MIRAIFFDAVGTLIHLPEGVGYHYSLVLRRHGVEVDALVLEHAFRLAWKRMPPRETTKVPRLDDDKGWWRGLVREVFAATVTVPFDFQACFEELYLHFAEPGVWSLYPEVRETLAALDKKCHLGVISNFDTRLCKILSNLDIINYFNSITVSSEAGADKPDPHIYRTAMVTAGVDAFEAMHVGDDPLLDWRPASLLGMHTFLLKRPRNSLLNLLESPLLTSPPSS